jgi:hypothetical protein
VRCWDLGAGKAAVVETPCRGGRSLSLALICRPSATNETALVSSPFPRLPLSEAAWRVRIGSHGLSEADVINSAVLTLGAMCKVGIVASLLASG